MLEDFYESLNIILKNKELDKLEPFFIQSLEDAREISDYNLYLTISNEMIAYFNSLGDMGKASEVTENIIILMDELYKNIFSDYEDNIMKSDTVEVTTNLAFDYLKYHQLTKSKNSFVLAIEISEKTNKLLGDYYCAALTGLGQVHFELKEYDLSISYYKKALKNMEINYGEGQSYGMICDNIAAIYILLNNSEEANYYQAKSSSIRGNSNEN